MKRGLDRGVRGAQRKMCLTTFMSEKDAQKGEN